jgi:hypothetical protein
MGGRMKPENISLTEALYRLLNHRSYRENFLNEATAEDLGLSEEDFSELSSIDREQLIASAERMAQKIYSGNHQGGQGLKSVFPECFSALEQQTQKNGVEIVYEFLESEHFGDYKELPFNGKGICIEQAFYGFVEERYWKKDSPLEAIVRNEFLLSLFKNISKMESPNFDLPKTFVSQNKLCRYSVQVYQHRLTEAGIETQPHFILYAAAGGHFISDEITPLIADILYGDDKPPLTRMPEVLKRHGLSMNVFLRTYGELAKMGLVG